MKAIYTLLILLIPFVGLGQDYDSLNNKDSIIKYIKSNGMNGLEGIWTFSCSEDKFSNYEIFIKHDNNDNYIGTKIDKNGKHSSKNIKLEIKNWLDLKYFKWCFGGNYWSNNLQILNINKKENIHKTISLISFKLDGDECVLRKDYPNYHVYERNINFIDLKFIENKNIVNIQEIKNAVQAEFENWLKKDEFEKNSDYLTRVSTENQNEKVNEISSRLVDELRHGFATSSLKMRDWLIEGDYDSENESFVLANINSNQKIILNVPIEIAKKFKVNFFDSKKSKANWSEGVYIRLINVDLVNNELLFTKLKFLLDDEELNFDYNNQYYYSENKNLKNYDFDLVDIDFNKYTDIKIISKVNLLENISTNIKIKHKYAIVIGNQDYKSFQKNLKHEQNVPFAANDASLFKEYALKTLGVEEDNLYYLENATSGQMNQTIDLVTKIVGKLGNKAELIFYYAGHGFPDELTKEPYLIPVDVSTSYLNNAISLDNLYDKFSKTGAKRVLAFVDACFSGGAREKSLLVSRGVKINPKMTNISNNLVVFSASSETQSALPYYEQGHGMFTFYLLNKLKQSSGKISLGELYDYISEEVSLNSLKINQTEQEPNVIFSPTIENKWRDWQLY